jgi:hypothetical protein
MRCIQCTAVSTTSIPTTIPQNEALRPTIESTIAALPKDAKWAVKEWSYRNIKDNGTILAEALQSPQRVLGVSDGSFKDALGTASYTLLGHDEQGGILSMPTSGARRLGSSKFVSLRTEWPLWNDSDGLRFVPSPPNCTW